MKTIDTITSDDISFYITTKYKGSCAFCGSKEEPYTFISQDNPQKLIFTELKAYDAFGNINPFNASTPVIPLTCPNCGNLSYLTVFHVLNFFNQVKHD
jgi:hypothetical protein